MTQGKSVACIGFGTSSYRAAESRCAWFGFAPPQLSAARFAVCLFRDIMKAKKRNEKNDERDTCGADGAKNDGGM